MEVILQKEVPMLGKEGDIVKVAAGYANNYLLPRGLAVRATSGNLKQLEAKRALMAKKEATARAEAEGLAKQVEGKKVRIEVRAGEGGKLYGSVTSKDVAEAVSSQLKIAVDKRQLEMAEHIKEAGAHEIKVRFYPEVEVSLTAEVIAVEQQSKE